MKKQKNYLVPICADCGAAAQISEMAGTTFFICPLCNGTSIKTVEIHLDNAKEIHNGK